MPVVASGLVALIIFIFAPLAVSGLPPRWGVNGACSVLGSIIAVAISMWLGIRVNLAMAALLYALQIPIFVLVGARADSSSSSP